MKVKQPGTNMMAIIFVPDCCDQRKATRNKYKAIIFVPGSRINESKATRNEYDGHDICTGFFINEWEASAESVIDASSICVYFTHLIFMKCLCGTLNSKALLIRN